ncbi:MAG: BatD family protein [Lentisphaeria bacterium]|nr:BatD family protein [Lentisphaeria bacterium]
MKYLHNSKAEKIFLTLSFALFLLLPFALPGAEGTGEAYLMPETVTVNEPAYLVLRMQDRKPDTGKLPAVKDLRWISNAVRTSSRVSIVNGKMSSTYENHIPFVVTRKGRYVIPLADLFNGVKSSQKEISFQAMEQVVRSAEERIREANNKENSGEQQKGKDEKIAIEDAIFSDVTVPGSKKSCYVGEEIPLRVDLYILQGLSGRPVAYPQIKFGENNSAIFKDYSRINEENPNFERITRSRKRIGKREYSTYTFHTRFTPIAPGEMKITSLLPAILLVPDQQGNTRRHRGGFFDDDDFFGSFFRQERRIERSLPAHTLLTVLPLPPLQEKDAFYTGLTGDWKGEVQLSPPPYKTGEPVNLKIRFTGNGSLDFFKAPTLNMENFRIYPPELEKNSSFAEIRYTLIPTKPTGGKEENFRLVPLAVFDPASGKYVLTEFSRNIVVEKGKALLPVQQGNMVIDGKTPSKTAPGLDQNTLQEREHISDVLYLKKDHGKTVSLPLWKNHILPTVIFVTAGLLFILVCQCIAIFRKIRTNDPLFARRKEANLLRKKLLKVLSALPPEELPEQSGSIAETLAGLAGFAPGTDLKECAAKIAKEDPHFASMLEKMADCAWMPAAKHDLDGKFKKDFLKKFSRISFLFAVILFSVYLFPGTLAAEEKSAVKYSAVPANIQETSRAYDAGNFEAAEKYYRKLLKEGKYSGEILYDLGNTLYRQGRYPEALVSYEQALRLSPRDPDILENLNLVRRKLMLQEKGKVNSPADIFPVLRDQLRPDEWLLAAGIGFFLLCIGFGIRTLRGNASLFFRISAAGGLVILLISLWGFFSAMNGSYSGKYAIVTADNIRVYSLPSAKSRRLTIKFRPGEELSIEEKRQDFFRVRSGNAEGWVKAEDIRPLQANQK